MSKVLTSFLVGIGYDTKGLEDGSKKIQSSMQGVKGAALGISAALVGAFGAAISSTLVTSRRVDELALATQNLRTSPNYVYDLGNAIRLMGGDAADAVSTIQSLEQILNNAQMRGEFGPLLDLPLAGVDITGMDQAESGSELLRMISEQLPALDEGQRALVQEALGLSDAVFRTIVNGTEELGRVMAKANNLTGNIEQLTENSRRLAENTSALGLAVEGVTNEIAERFLPGLIGVTDWATSFLENNKTPIADVVDTAKDAAMLPVQFLKFGATGGIGGAAVRGAQEAFSEGSAVRRILGIDDGGIKYERPSGVSPDWSPNPSFMPMSAEDTIMPSRTSAEETEARRAESLASALSRSPVKVENFLTIQLDGQAVEAKIIDVNERTSYSALEDIKSTTER